ncbi:hypothetical protein DTO271G3_6585 [Paecilomyces variotii]|nr:hypothetical protein DTO271G3_6585 [Paecilomyces variotii]
MSLLPQTDGISIYSTKYPTLLQSKSCSASPSYASRYRRLPPLPATALDLPRTAIPPYSASRSRLLRVSSSSSASVPRLLSLSSSSRILTLARTFSSAVGSKNGCGAREESNSITIGSDMSPTLDSSRLVVPVLMSAFAEGTADEKAGFRIWIPAGWALGLQDEDDD